MGWSPFGRPVFSFQFLVAKCKIKKQVARCKVQGASLNTIQDKIQDANIQNKITQLVKNIGFCLLYSYILQNFKKSFFFLKKIRKIRKREDTARRASTILGRIAIRPYNSEITEMR